MKPSQLGKYLDGRDAATIRRWSATFKQFLSPHATPAPGQSRRYTEYDARVLLHVATLRNTGLEFHQIEDRLEEMQAANWQDLPELPMEWGLDEETMPIGAAIAKASDVAEIAILQRELQTALANLHEAESRIEQLETALTEERQTTIELRGELLETTTKHNDELNQARIEVEKLRGQVDTLNARLESFHMVLGKRPLNITVIIASTAILVAVLVVLIFIISSLI